MKDLMDRSLVFGIGYAKPLPPSIDRYQQVAKMAAAHCQSTGEGIDLVHIWTGPGHYDWSVVNPDVGLTLDQAVDLAIANSMEVFGGIGTTPWWAMPGDGTTSSLTQDANAGQNYVKVASTTGFVTGRHVRLQDDSASDNVEAQEIQSIPDGQTLIFTANLARSYTVAANGRCTQVQEFQHLWPPDEQYAQAFIDACEEVASHFFGRVRYYGFWNEPDAGGWHDAPQPVEYTTWLKRAHDGVKAGDPDALFSIGGLLIDSEADGDNQPDPGRNDTSFLQAIYDRIGGLGHDPDDYFDALELHPYEWRPDYQGIPPINIDGVEAHYNLMSSYGDDDKSIWVSEYGWDMNPDKQPPWSEQQQAGWLQETLDLLSSASRPYITEASHLLICDLDGLKYGLCYADLSVRLAYGAFRNYAAPRTPRWESRAPFVTMV